VLSLALVLSLIHIGWAKADAIDDCIALKQQNFEARQTFIQSGSVTCPSGDIVGFPPRSRKHNRNGTITYTAPTGYVIEDKSVNSIVIENVSSNNGTHGAVNINAEKTSVSVQISCSGKSVGQGRAWQNINIKGAIVQAPSTEQIKQWVLQCVRE